MVDGPPLILKGVSSLTNLTLRIEAPPNRVPVAAFASVLTETVSILTDLQHSRSQRVVTWYLTDLKIGSAVAVLTPEDISDESLVVGTEFVNGLKSAEEGRALPEYFSATSLAKLTSMVRMLGTPGIEFLEASIERTGAPIVSARATNNVRENIRRLQQPRRRSYGSITGTLDTISTRKDTKKFQILDPVSRRPVSCQFSVDQIDVIKDALTKRVVVSGTVVRNITGQPLRIEDGELQVLDPSTPLTNLIGVDPQFTGGLSLPDYFERIS